MRSLFVQSAAVNRALCRASCKSLRSDECRSLSSAVSKRPSTNNAGVVGIETSSKARVLSPCVIARWHATIVNNDENNDDHQQKDDTLPDMGSISSVEMEETFQPDRTIAMIEQAAMYNQGGDDRDVSLCRDVLESYQWHLHEVLRRIGDDKNWNDVFGLFAPSVEQLLSPHVVDNALVALTRCQFDTPVLAEKVRELERFIGKIGRTPLSGNLSFSLLKANAKAGNVGRVMSLLGLRKSRDYKPHPKEFVLAITAIDAACLTLRRSHGRNVYLNESQQPALDNPTRWLDAILLNMHERGVPLTLGVANRMLALYSSTGRTGKALHFFHKVVPTEDENVPNLRYRNLPPYYKVPDSVRQSKDHLVALPGDQRRTTKLQRETQADWSIALTAAFAFADSLSHGACGHDPIELNIVSWNLLIKACCFRGALWRAMNILDEILPARGLEPDIYSYNTLLGGLARVGDVQTQKKYLDEMLLQKQIKPDDFTVQAIVDGLLNMGNVAGAITLVQDMFNQYNVVPPYTTHLKILEQALATGLVYEAKRHLYFIQQLWKWTPNQYHSDAFKEKMRLTQHNPKLGRDAMEQLFRYFGHELSESDFL